MRKTTLSTITALAIMVGLAVPAFALIVGDGKGKEEADCNIGLEGYDDSDLQPFGKGKKEAITCVDGEACDADGMVNDQCEFRLAARVGITGVDGCTPREGKTIKAKALGKVKPKVKVDAAGTLPSDGSSATGTFVSVPVPVKVTKKGATKPRGKVTLLYKSKPKDKDKFNLLCAPAGSGGTTTTTLPPRGDCPDNPDGGPAEWILKIGESGNDLDNGWTGISHNFPVTPNGILEMCLTGCDATTDTVCDGVGEIGPGTSNGPVFGAPLPLLAAGVPVCVVNRFARDVVGTFDIATGDADLDVGLLSDVYFTDQSEVCPRCNSNGRCTSGQNNGGQCEVDATLEVAQALGNTTYNLSVDCPPSGNPSTLVINFQPLTTGTTDPPLMGETPCTGPGGITPQPNDCNAGCGAQCTGNACVAMVPDPVNPANMICQDSKGGLAQRCCNDNTSLPCFPLENDGVITRTGRPEVPQPALPDTTYPKTGTGTLASVFCEAATQTNTINLSTGLPGPAALLLTGPFVLYDNLGTPGTTTSTTVAPGTTTTTTVTPGTTTTTTVTPGTTTTTTVAP